MTLHTVTPYGPAGASSRVRIFDWLDHLGLDAVRHTYRGAKDNRPGAMLRDLPGTLRAEAEIRRFDPAGATVLMSREASPFGRGSLEASILRRAARGVYDFDDALFVPVGGLRERLMGTKACQRAVAAADVVIAGNDYLADFASRHTSHVQVIPSCVEPGDYRAKTTWGVGETPRIVWLGSPSTEQYVVGLIPALTQVHQRTGARLILISGPADNPALAPIGAFTDRVAWSPQAAADALASSDVAIGPLDDTAWARGKCAYKLLQYAAAALPMAASPVGANSLALQRFDGVAVEAGEDWASALTALLAEPEARRAQRGATALGAVHEHYSFTAWADRWRAAVGADGAQ